MAKDKESSEGESGEKSFSKNIPHHELIEHYKLTLIQFSGILTKTCPRSKALPASTFTTKS
jgi:hypothetical protein